MSDAPVLPVKVKRVWLLDFAYPERDVEFSDGSGRTEYWDEESSSWKPGGDPSGICKAPRLSEDSHVAISTGAFDPSTSSFKQK